MTLYGHSGIINKSRDTDKPTPDERGNKMATYYYAYVGFSGEDYWDIIGGSDKDNVKADAERSAKRCEEVEGNYPHIEYSELV